MNAAGVLAIFGIFVIVWWVGRRVAQALDRYELMKNQRKRQGNGHLDTTSRSRADRVRVRVHPRASGSR